jgi:hypothetical protein
MSSALTGLRGVVHEQFVVEPQFGLAGSLRRQQFRRARYAFRKHR